MDKLTVSEHMVVIEEWCKEVEEDQGIDIDTCYSDVVKAYILQVDDPKMVKEIQRCTGVDW